MIIQMIAMTVQMIGDSKVRFRFEFVKGEKHEKA